MGIWRTCFGVLGLDGVSSSESDSLITVVSFLFSFLSTLGDSSSVASGIPLFLFGAVIHFTSTYILLLSSLLFTLSLFLLHPLCCISLLLRIFIKLIITGLLNINALLRFFTLNCWNLFRKSMSLSNALLGDKGFRDLFFICGHLLWLSVYWCGMTMGEVPIAVGVDVLTRGISVSKTGTKWFGIQVFFDPSFHEDVLVHIIRSVLFSNTLVEGSISLLSVLTARSFKQFTIG